ESNRAKPAAAKYFFVICGSSLGRAVNYEKAGPVARFCDSVHGANRDWKLHLQKMLLARRNRAFATISVKNPDRNRLRFTAFWCARRNANGAKTNPRNSNREHAPCKDELRFSRFGTAKRGPEPPAR